MTITAAGDTMAVVRGRTARTPADRAAYAAPLPAFTGCLPYAVLVSIRTW